MYKYKYEKYKQKNLELSNKIGGCVDIGSYRGYRELDTDKFKEIINSHGMPDFDEPKVINNINCARNGLFTEVDGHSIYDNLIEYIKTQTNLSKTIVLVDGTNIGRNTNFRDNYYYYIDENDKLKNTPSIGYLEGVFNISVYMSKLADIFPNNIFIVFIQGNENNIEFINSISEIYTYCKITLLCTSENIYGRSEFCHATGVTHNEYDDYSLIRIYQILSDINNNMYKFCNDICILSGDRYGWYFNQIPLKYLQIKFTNFSGGDSRLGYYTEILNEYPLEFIDNIIIQQDKMPLIAFDSFNSFLEDQIRNILRINNDVFNRIQYNAKEIFIRRILDHDPAFIHDLYY